MTGATVLASVQVVFVQILRIRLGLPPHSLRLVFLLQFHQVGPTNTTGPVSPSTNPQGPTGAAPPPPVLPTADQFVREFTALWLHNAVFRAMGHAVV